MRVRIATCAIAAILLSSVVGNAAERWGLQQGKVDLQSPGPLAFGPDGILFVGDNKAATVYAIDTGDKEGDPSKVKINIQWLNAHLARALGSSAGSVDVNDLAVNPPTGSVYLSVTDRAAASPATSLVKIDAAGKLHKFSLEKVAFSKSVLPNPPEDKLTGEGRRRRNRRMETITDLAYAGGQVLVAGLASASVPSNIRGITFPFSEADDGAGLEIYHGAHGKYENGSAIRTLVPFNIGGEPSLLAGFVCTPLVKFPIKSVAAGKQIRGTTVAELGNRNKPLDMIVYKKDGKSFLLLANSARGVMKISTEQLDRKEGITEPVKGGGIAGQVYETVKTMQNVVQLDRLDDQRAVILEITDGAQNLKTVALP